MGSRYNSGPHNFIPEAPSRWQCDPTSDVFYQEMRKYFPHLPLRLMHGNLIIQDASGQSIPDVFTHAWTALRFASGNNYIVFDFTTDQARYTNEKVIVELQHTLKRRGIDYQPYTESKRISIIDKLFNRQTQNFRNRMRPPSPEVLRLIQRYNRSISPKKP